MIFPSFLILLLFVASLFSGFANVIAGGGSVLTLPLLLYLGLDPAEANGTNRISILLQTSWALSIYKKKGEVQNGMRWSESVWVLPGAVLGALMAFHLDLFWFKKILAVVLLWMIVEPMIPKQKIPLRASPFLFKLGLLGIGFYGAFIQIGLGFLILWLLRSFLNQDLIRLNHHKLFLVLFLNIPAFFIFLGTGKIFWTLGLLMSLGNMLGAWVAVHWSFQKGEIWVRRVLNGIVLLFAGLLFLG
jgi:uncharacterized membrane protein YfcA